MAIKAGQYEVKLLILAGNITEKKRVSDEYADS